MLSSYTESKPESIKALCDNVTVKSVTHFVAAAAFADTALAGNGWRSSSSCRPAAVYHLLVRWAHIVASLRQSVPLDTNVSTLLNWADSLPVWSRRFQFLFRRMIVGRDTKRALVICKCQREKVTH